MKKIILSKIDLYYGKVEMPIGFEIDQKKLSVDILSSITYNQEFPFSRTYDMLQTYLREHIFLEFNIKLQTKQSFGQIFKSSEHSNFLSQIDIMDLKNSPNYVMLYGVNITKNSCKVILEYDDNRKKNNNYEIVLNNNDFLLFSSSLKYNIITNKINSLNIILTTTYV
jgi:hypothetical protein